MAEGKKKNDAVKTRWIDGLKSEFRKIIWPDKEDLAKQTTAVIIVSVIVGVIIAIVDTVVQYGIDFLIK